MNANNPNRQELMGRAVGKFWATIPYIWHSLRAYMHGKAREEDQLTARQFAILRSVRDGADSVSALAEKGPISRPATSRMVDHLVSQGYLARKTDPDDRRYLRLTLTPTGAALLETQDAQMRAWMSARLENLSDEQIETVIHAMDLLGVAFKRERA
jgi:DNA-binding MarR family transcriptional regulator